jgi:hypothetical protein
LGQAIASTTEESIQYELYIKTDNFGDIIPKDKNTWINSVINDRSSY